MKTLILTYILKYIKSLLMSSNDSSSKYAWQDVLVYELLLYSMTVVSSVNQRKMIVTIFAQKKINSFN